MEPIETREYKGYAIEIYQDEYPTDPRSWDNLGTMVCFHKRYNLGDSHDFRREDAGNDLDDLAVCIEETEDDKILWLPLYLYDHSGITMNTTGFSCPWDSGTVGLIYITYTKLRYEYSWKNLTKQRKDRIYTYLDSEVKEYDLFLTGEVYGYIIKDADGNDLDSCWGFSG